VKLDEQTFDLIQDSTKLEEALLDSEELIDTTVPLKCNVALAHIILRDAMYTRVMFDAQVTLRYSRALERTNS